jgi:predicted MFS family arabinose efflux permease
MSDFTDADAHGRVWLIGLAAFCVVSSHTLYLGVLPVLLLDQGLGGLTMGAVIGAFAAGAFLARIGLVRACGRLRKFAITGTMLLVASQLGFVFFGIAPELVFFRFMNGIGNGLLFFCLFSAMPVQSHLAARAIGVISACAALALLVGSPAGIQIIQTAGPHELFLTALCTTALGGAAVIRVAGLIVVSDSRATAAPAKKPSNQLLAAIFLVAATLGALEVSIPLVGRLLGHQVIMVAMVIFGAFFILSRLVGGILTEYELGYLALCFVLFLGATAASVVALYLSTFTLFTAALLVGTALGLANTYLMTLMVTGVTATDRGKPLTAGQLSSDIGAVVGVVLVSAVNSWGLNFQFWLVAFLCFGAMLFLLPARAAQATTTDSE